MRSRALALLSLVLVAPRLVAQTPVPVYQEPHHHLVLEAGPVRVLDVRIPPGDTTLFHIHDTPFLAVRIAVSSMDAQQLGEAWSGVGPEDLSHFYPGAIDSDTSYVVDAVTHRVANAGTTLFHLIGITNAGPGASPDAGIGTDLPGALESSSRWFGASRLAVPPGTESPWYSASAPVVIVQPGEGRTEVQRDSGGASPLEAPGAWAYLPAGTRYRVRNAGEFSATLVFVAVR